MESSFLQNIRYKLQKRVRRLNGADLHNFFYLLKQFLIFVKDSELLASLIDEIRAKVPDLQESVDNAWAGGDIYGENEVESAAIAFGVLEAYAAATRPEDLWTCAHQLANDGDGMLDAFRARYLEPLYEYLDEHLDDRKYILYALIRYKHLCEWFRRDELFRAWEADTKHGEEILALDLYRYLFECGIEFSIEPRSASGEPDLIARQTSEHEPLIADAKVFNPDKSKGKSYIVRGFHQVHRYASDYNESIGYLVIFNTSPKPIRFVLSESSQAIPRVVYNHKTIFLLEIDVYPHPDPASKRGLPDAVQITEAELCADPVTDESA